MAIPARVAMNTTSSHWTLCKSAPNASVTAGRATFREKSSVARNMPSPARAARTTLFQRLAAGALEAGAGLAGELIAHEFYGMSQERVFGDAGGRRPIVYKGVSVCYKCRRAPSWKRTPSRPAPVRQEREGRFRGVRQGRAAGRGVSSPLGHKNIAPASSPVSCRKLGRGTAGACERIKRLRGINQTPGPSPALGRERASPGTA